MRAALGLYALLSPLHRVGQGFACTKPEEADGVVPALLQLTGVHRRTEALQVAGRGIDAEFQIAHMPCHQGLIGDLAATHHAVDVFTNDVDDAIAHAQGQLNFWIACKEPRQGWYQQHARQWAWYIHPQPPARCHRRAGQAGLGVVHIDQ
ncbi:hypothetical protein D3C76_1251670 [compost metagenome]